MEDWNNYYSKIRDGHRMECNQRRREITKKIPELSMWQDDFASVFSLKAFDEDTIEFRISKIAKMEKQRDELLLKNNVDPSDWHVSIDCKLCRDYGYIRQSECACLKELKANRVDIRSEVEIDSEQSFSNFDISIFPLENSQRDKIAKARDIAIEYCEKFPNNARHSILLVGNAGLGKSYLLNCIANELQKNCYSVRKTTGYKFHHMLNDVVFNDNDMKPYKKLLSCDLLLIDDLGTEPVTKNQLSESYIHALVSERFDKKKPTIIAANYSMSELNKRYGERTTSRLLDKDNYRAILLKGEDVRINPSSQ